MAYKAYPLLSCHGTHSILLPFAGPHTATAYRIRRTTEYKIVRWRTYAQHARSEEGEEHSDLTWPQSSQHGVPTPYEIFRQKKGAPYSKRRFYELVKIYHPDRDIHHESYSGCLSRKIRHERYRLIIAANDILSDPAKRHAYDRWGAGWHDQPEVKASRNAKDPDQEDRAYSGTYEDYATAANNATWEDWEQWYRRRYDAQHPAPRYVSNERFVGLVVLFIMIGASLEFSRAARMSTAFKEQVEARHAVASEELAKRRKQLADMGGQDARVQDFLRTRDTGFRGSAVTTVQAQAQSPNSGWK